MSISSDDVKKRQQSSFRHSPSPGGSPPPRGSSPPGDDSPGSLRSLIAVASCVKRIVTVHLQENTLKRVSLRLSEYVSADGYVFAPLSENLLADERLSPVVGVFTYGEYIFAGHSCSGDGQGESGGDETFASPQQYALPMVVPYREAERCN